MSALTDAHITGQARIRAQVVAYLTALWQSYGSYNEPQADEFSTTAAVAVVAAQRTSVALTNAFIGRMLGTGPIGIDAGAVVSRLRGDTTPEQVYRRPFQTVWTDLSKGRPYEDAVHAGLSRAKATAEMDVQLAHFAGYQAVQDAEPRIKGYRRVPDGGACAYCRKIAGAFVKRADASPLHARCGCGLRPELEEHPVTPLPDGVAVHEHGETGLQIGSDSHNFTRL